jgi:ubiquinone/menaquinone biosynthesis C-methylase UbiE
VTQFSRVLVGYSSRWASALTAAPEPETLRAALLELFASRLAACMALSTDQITLAACEATMCGWHRRSIYNQIPELIVLVVLDGLGRLEEYLVMALYDLIGIGYDATRQADPYLLSRLLHHLQSRIDARYLDVGCGSGNYTIAMRKAGVVICGIDLSATMLARAREKSPEVPWLKSNALALPFRDGSFAGVIMTFVHHHLSNPVAGLHEIRRVLMPGGRLVLLNATAEQTAHFWLIEYFPHVMEQAIASCARVETDEALAAAGLSIIVTELYEVADDLKDWFLYCGKRKPERYLDPRVRAGISAFACAQDQDEVARGVERLAADVRSGRIASVMRQYEWNGGDYMFTVAVR